MSHPLPRLLDLFCGAGGAAVGYHRAGFEIVGVDRVPQPQYPFQFYRFDALEFGFRYAREFAAVHASPPCQWGTAYARRRHHVKPSANVLQETQYALRMTRGIPHVIEQPPHGAPFMRDPVQYCGSSFDLDIRRHRLFESNIALVAPPCDHAWQTARFAPTTNRTNLRRTVEIGVWRIPLNVQQRAMGIDWMSLPALSQAIPPAYTEHIGLQLLQHLALRVVA
jgi:DNA (cytosine-5)-methyltransferase 1